MVTWANMLITAFAAGATARSAGLAGPAGGGRAAEVSRPQIRASGGPVIDHPELACPPVALEPNWPTFHITSNITGNATLRIFTGASDANGIFKYKGLFHAMEQPWAHAVSAYGAHWYHIKQVLIPGTNPGGAPGNSSSEDGYDCDGTVSFPDLGNGPTPVILYGPDGGVVVPPPNSSGRGVLRAVAEPTSGRGRGHSSGCL
jgi:hypothetical protein